MGIDLRTLIAAGSEDFKRLARTVKAAAEFLPGKQRAARFTGLPSQRKKKALVEEQFLLRWKGPPFVSEYHFHPTRKWRFDYAWPEQKVALEIEGATFINGAHNRGKGYAEDVEKYNEAVRLGWRVYRLSTGNDVDTAIAQIMAIVQPERSNV